MRAVLIAALIAPSLALAAPSTAELTGQAKWVSEAPVEKIVGTAAGKGTLNIDLENLAATTGEISMSVASMKTGNDTRDGHLQGAEWLDAKQFPTITFKVAKVEVTKAPSGDAVKSAELTVSGAFTLHGVTTQLTAPATVKWKGDKLKISTKFQIKLAEYQIKGKEGIVGSKVGETIDVEVTLQGAVK